MFTFVIFDYSLEGPRASKTRTLHDRSYDISSTSFAKYDLIPIAREKMHKIWISVKNSLKNRQIGQFSRFSRPQVCTFEVVQN